MQREDDSEYYLHRDFDGKYSFYGTPFLDFRCTIDSDNGIIYGRNINGGRMFGALHVYSSESYYKEHSEISFRAGDEYREYVNKILSGSLYQTEMGKQVGAELEKKTPEEFFRKYQFLTLSTCRSWMGRDARLLVISVRKREI